MTKKQVKEWLETIAVKKTSALNGNLFWASKDKSLYLCNEGDETKVKFLAVLGVTLIGSTNGKAANIAFSSTKKCWIGWSHRAYCDFVVGSKVKRGDVAYNPNNQNEWVASQVAFWLDKEYEKFISKEIKKGQLVIVTKYNNKVPNTTLRGTTNTRTITVPKSFNGRGEWVAKTLADAKQMAIDFADNIG